MLNNFYVKMHRLISISIYLIAISAMQCLSDIGAQNLKFADRVGRYCEVSKCNEYQYTYGPDFMKAFHFDGLIQNVQPDGYIVRLRLFVTAPSNVKIRLGETESNSHYDFVLGGENNTVSWLQMNDTKILAKLQTPSIVSETYPHRVNIEITNAGRIQVYINRYTTPFMEAIHLNPSPVTFIAFAADKEDYAEYFFDCEDSNSDDDPSAATTTPPPTTTATDSSVVLMKSSK